MLIPFKVPQRSTRYAYSRFARPVAVAAISLGAALCAGMAHAAQEQVDEVSKLLEQGKAAQAAKQAEAYLKQNPADVQLRFLQGVIAAEQRQNAQAIKIFTALTREYPNLPEPYNNLAVLYAAEGQERKASEVLEQAIRTNPSYATAHENLGDLYARMASDAYAKALQLDGSRQAIQPKLALITQIFPKQGGAQPKVTVAQNNRDDRSGAAAAAAKAEQTKAAEAKAAETRAAEAKAAEFKAAEVKAADAKLAEAKAAEAKAAQAKAAEAKAAEAKAAQAKAAETKAAEAKLAEAKAAEAKAKAADEAKVAAAAKAAAASTAVAQAAADDKKAADAPAKAAGADEVESAVKAWATAWAGQDINRYLDAYSDHFSPADGSSLAKWKEQRRQRIVGRASIVVTVRDLKVTVDGGDKATAQFRQYYASGALKTTTRKTLRMQREKGQWRITHEGTGG